MNPEALQVVLSALLSVLSAGGIIFALSSWLGKVWADRILSRETHELQIRLAHAQGQVDRHLQAAQTALDLAREVRSRAFHDKLDTYRGIVDEVSSLLAKLDAHSLGRSLPPDGGWFDKFNEQRMRLYGHLAMVAPQEVMDANDRLMDHLLQVCHGQQHYDWESIRVLAQGLINEVRKDIGVNPSPIAYSGVL